MKSEKTLRNQLPPTESKNLWDSAVQRNIFAEKLFAALQFLLEVLAWLKTWRQVRFFVESSCCSPVDARKNVFNEKERSWRQTRHAMFSAALASSPHDSRLVCELFACFQRQINLKSVYSEVKNRFFSPQGRSQFHFFSFHSLMIFLFTSFIRGLKPQRLSPHLKLFIDANSENATGPVRRKTVSPIKKIASTLGSSLKCTKKVNRVYF